MGQVILQNCLGGGNGTPAIFADVLENSASFSITAADIAGTKEIADYAFYHSQLKSIEISTKITKIGDYAFAYCTNLTDIYYEGTALEWSQLTKGTNWDYNTSEYVVHYVDEDL